MVLNFLTWCSRRVVDHSFHLDWSSDMFCRKGISKYAKITLYTRKKLIYLFYLHGKYHKRGADVSVSHKMFALIRVSVSFKQSLTLSKKYLYLHQTEPLFEPNRASVYVWFYYSYSLCGYVSTLSLGASYLTLGKVSGGAPPIPWNFPNGTMWPYHYLQKEKYLNPSTCCFGKKKKEEEQFASNSSNVLFFEGPKIAINGPKLPLR